MTMTSERPGTSVTRRAARVIGVALAATLLVGLVSGLLARLLMRLIALTAGEPVAFTLVGTAGILFVCVVCTLPGALALSVLHGRARPLAWLIALALVVPHVLTFLGSEGELFEEILTPERAEAVMALTAGYALMLLGAVYVLGRVTRALLPRRLTAPGADSETSGTIGHVTSAGRG